MGLYAVLYADGVILELFSAFIVNANHSHHVNGCDASRSRFVARSSLFLENLHRLPRFVRRRLFIFERAL